MKIVDDLPSGLSALDRPNSYIGRAVPRPNLQRLMQGRGQYVSDVVLPAAQCAKAIRDHWQIESVLQTHTERSSP